MSRTIYTTHIFAQKLSEAALVANWTGGTTRRMRTDDAKNSLMQLISGIPVGEDDAREWAVDLIECALDNANDMDVTFRDFAEAVLDAIVAAAIPEDADK